MSTKTSPEFISVFEFEKEHGINRQKLYRLIREGRIKPEDFKLIERVVKRLHLRKDLEL
jgi:hypothetical protein